MTPLPRFDVMTPLGPAICVGVCITDDAPEWVTFIKRTGEPWFWGNRHIRLFPYATSGVQNSPFTHLTPAITQQIERYKVNGWL